MRLSGNTVLITGGATGIGHAMAEAFVRAGNEVIICGRRDARLEAARARLPALHVRPCDITQPAERAVLVEWVATHFSEWNVLVNNAGIQLTI